MKSFVTTQGYRGLRKSAVAILTVMVLAIALVTTMAQNAYAAGVALNLHYKAAETEKPIVGLQVNVYKLASIEGNQFVLAPDFENIADVLGWENGRTTVTNDSAWFSSQAETMDAYIRAGGPSPTVTDVTSSEGTIVFSGLDEALYLILPVGDGTHLFTSSLVQLTSDASSNVTVEPKSTTPNNPITEVKVVKHWSGDTGSEANRPASIKVQLVCDEKVEGAPVELSEANNWTHTWFGLDASVVHKWDVYEVDPPSGYSISINEDEGNFTITNTLNPPPPNNPPSTVTPVPPTTTNGVPPTTTTTKTITGKLPQTGQLWWPVPVLFAAGLVAVGAGRIISSRSSKAK